MPATQLRRPPSPPRKGFNHGLLAERQFDSSSFSSTILRWRELLPTSFRSHAPVAKLAHVFLETTAAVDLKARSWGSSAHSSPYLESLHGRAASASLVSALIAVDVGQATRSTLRVMSLGCVVLEDPPSSNRIVRHRARRGGSPRLRRPLLSSTRATQRSCRRLATQVAPHRAGSPRSSWSALSRCGRARSSRRPIAGCRL